MGIGSELTCRSLGFQDLKNLRSQLYSTAEYFELSYTIDDQKQMYVDHKIR